MKIISNLRMHAEEISILSVLMISGCLCQTINDTQNIFDSILRCYNRDIRPVFNQSEAVQVDVTFDLLNIKEFDEVSERLTIVSILYLKWTDFRLTWNPLDHNGALYINIPVKYIWKPYLLLSTPFDEVRPLGGEENEWTIAKVSYTGSVLLSFGDSISSSCSIDVRNFPFDTQTCPLKFLPWGLLDTEVVLTAEQDQVFRTYYTEHGTWDFVNSSVRVMNIVYVSSMVCVDLVLQRRPEYFVVNVVLPIVLISCLTVAVYLLPIESGERVSYSVTVFLALAVFMTIVGDNMPKKSKHMATICYYLLVNVGHSTLICFETIICISVFYRRGRVPQWLVRLLSRKQVRQIKSTSVGTIDYINDEQGERQLRRSGNDADADTNTKDDCCTLTWQDVGKAADKCFGVLSILFLTCSVIAFVMHVT